MIYRTTKCPFILHSSSPSPVSDLEYGLPVQGLTVMTKFITVGNPVSENAKSWVIDTGKLRLDLVLSLNVKAHLTWLTTPHAVEQNNVTNIDNFSGTAVGYLIRWSICSHVYVLVCSCNDILAAAGHVHVHRICRYYKISKLIYYYICPLKLSICSHTVL